MTVAIAASFLPKSFDYISEIAFFTAGYSETAVLKQGLALGAKVLNLDPSAYPKVKFPKFYIVVLSKA